MGNKSSAHFYLTPGCQGCIWSCCVQASVPNLSRQAQVLSSPACGFMCPQRLFPPLVWCLARLTLTGDLGRAWIEALAQSLWKEPKLRFWLARSSRREEGRGQCSLAIISRSGWLSQRGISVLPPTPVPSPHPPFSFNIYVCLIFKLGYLNVKLSITL